jgi:hypothetical protein
MNKPTLIFQGPCFSRSGYGDHCRDLLKSLRKMDRFDVKLIPLKWGNTPQNETYADTEFGQWMLSSVLTSSSVEKPDVFIQVSVANEFEPKGHYNIGITAGVETTIAPLDFIHGCNKMQLVITPSEFTRQVLLSTAYQQKNENGQMVQEFRITTPIVTLFEGVDTDIYDTIEWVD